MVLRSGYRGTIENRLPMVVNVCVQIESAEFISLGQFAVCRSVPQLGNLIPGSSTTENAAVNFQVILNHRLTRKL
jgi:hypothetical protein